MSALAALATPSARWRPRRAFVTGSGIATALALGAISPSVLAEGGVLPDDECTQVGSRCAELGGPLAEEVPPAVAPPRTELPGHGVDIGALFGMLNSTGFGVTRTVGVVLGLDVLYSLNQRWRVGGYGAIEGVFAYRADWDREYQFDAFAWGARGECHLGDPDGVDAWLGADLGALWTGVRHPTDWGVEIGADAGVDFHLSTAFAIGLFFMARVPFARPQRDGYPPVGLIYSTPFFIPGPFPVPGPALRLVVTL